MGVPRLRRSGPCSRREYDPVTCAPLTEIVPVAGVGTVLSWDLAGQPLEGQPLDRPFAWALIQTRRCRHRDAARRGHRWSSRRHRDRRPGTRALGRRAGRGDHRHRLFSAGRRAEPSRRGRRPGPGDDGGVPCSLAVQHTASRRRASSCALQNGTLLGARSGDHGKVYFPPREADPPPAGNSTSSSNFRTPAR